MPSKNKVILASAGSGKTREIINRGKLGVDGNRVLYVSYTNNTVEDIRARLRKEKVGSERARVYTWYSFLLEHFVRPYQMLLHGPRIDNITFTDRESNLKTSPVNVRQNFLNGPRAIFSDKMSKFACHLIREKRAPTLSRLSEMYDAIYIDELQDLAHYDLDLLELLFESPINVILVGDYRQATLKTHEGKRRKQYEKEGIFHIIRYWAASGLLDLEYRTENFRSRQEICDFADSLFPEAPTTVSRNTHATGHDGVFLVWESDVPAYVSRFSPQCLRRNIKTKVYGGTALNFGAAKGLEFCRILIYPHSPFKRYLVTGDPSQLGGARTYVYVAITRARQSVGIVVNDGEEIQNIPKFSP
jgi:DNA helicase-2/ATP-dependent DNA helicase PcrA